MCVLSPQLRSSVESCFSPLLSQPSSSSRIQDSEMTADFLGSICKYQLWSAVFTKTDCTPSRLPAEWWGVCYCLDPVMQLLVFIFSNCVFFNNGLISFTLVPYQVRFYFLPIMTMNLQSVCMSSSGCLNAVCIQVTILQRSSIMNTYCTRSQCPGQEVIMYTSVSFHSGNDACLQ